MSQSPHKARQLCVDLAELRVNDQLLHELHLSGWCYGPALGTAPVVVVVGGITASPFPFGKEQNDAGWWSALNAPGLVDPERQTILCPAWPGNGSSFKGMDRPGTVPALSVMDLAELLAHWLRGIGCEQAVTYVGASLGGLVGIALAVHHPQLVARLISISAGLRPDGWGTATRHLQRELVRDGIRNGDIHTGMVRARQLGMLTYRSRDELDTRFGKLSRELKQPPVASYLDHHGKRFADAFPVNTFLLLSEAIDRSNLAQNPQALRQQLGGLQAEVFVVGVPGDLLFPWSLQNELHRELQAVGARSSLWKLDSDYGHDAFLADQNKLAELLLHCGALRQDTMPTAAIPPFRGVGTQPLRRIRIGMIGCGVVGLGVLELLQEQQQELAARYGVHFEVKRIVVRDQEKDRGPLAKDIARCSDPLLLIADPEVDVLVEVAGGSPDLGPVLRASLAAGKPVVTANKALLARDLAELATMAQRTQTPLACEAAVAAALPIMRHLSHRADEVERLLAIVNGTCNYIITRLEQDELALDAAIVEAQQLGLAEADPSADIDGLDAAAKLSILAYRSFGAWFRPSSFLVRGIRELSPADCDLAEAMGFRIRHIAQAARVGDKLHLSVEPLLLPDWHLLANVEEEYNSVYLCFRRAGDRSLFGKGAGGLPTASAVLGDLIDLAQDNSAQWPEPRDVELCDPKQQKRRHYLRVRAQPHPGLERRIESHFRRAGIHVQNRATRFESKSQHLAFLSSATNHESVHAVMQAIERLGRVEETVLLGVNE